jgi:hypothetical protein
MAKNSGHNIDLSQLLKKRLSNPLITVPNNLLGYVQGMVPSAFPWAYLEKALKYITLHIHYIHVY